LFVELSSLSSCLVVHILTTAPGFHLFRIISNPAWILQSLRGRNCIFHRHFDSALFVILLRHATVSTRPRSRKRIQRDTGKLDKHDPEEQRELAFCLPLAATSLRSWAPGLQLLVSSGTLFNRTKIRGGCLPQLFPACLGKLHQLGIHLAWRSASPRSQDPATCSRTSFVSRRLPVDVTRGCSTRSIHDFEAIRALSPCRLEPSSPRASDSAPASHWASASFGWPPGRLTVCPRAYAMGCDGARLPSVRKRLPQQRQGLTPRLSSRRSQPPSFGSSNWFISCGLLLRD
jgi:hypothetical protein